MNNTEVIAKLCHIIDLQNVIIQAQAMELNQLGAVVRAEEITAPFLLSRPPSSS